MLYDLLNLVQGYLDGDLTVQAVEIWLTSRLQPIIRSGDPATTHLANSIDADLIELGEGLIGEETLKERWRRYLDPVRVRVSSSSKYAHIYQGGVTTSVNRYVHIQTGALTGDFEVPKSDRTSSRAKDDPPPNHYVDERGVVTALPGRAA